MDHAYRPIAPGAHPPADSPAYGSTARRHPAQAPLPLAQAIGELTGPVFSPRDFPPLAGMARVDGREAIGERIVVAGQMRDEDGRPVPHGMIEVWQANAAGRYAHERDQHDAPLDPNFQGFGRVFTDADGFYRFQTIKPGAYPWRNHHNAWRPNHIHLSVFGPAFATRLITQMYFPGDPLLPLDPIFNTVPDPVARDRLVAAFDLALTEPEWALGYRFDIVLRGRLQTPFEAPHV